MHTLAAAAEYWPASQVVQADDDAADVYWPARQALTALKPVDAQYDPEVQGAHELCPAFAWKVPAPQGEQEVAAAAAYWPATQTPPTAVSPDDPQYDPAVHGVQAVADRLEY